MTDLQTFLGTSSEPYSHLEACFNYRRFSLRGDSLAAFHAPLNVVEGLVDIEDVKAEEFISSKLALNFILELFRSPPVLERAVCWQYLLINCIFRQLLAQAHSLSILDTRKKKSYAGVDARLEGDDVMVRSADGRKGKLSVSIATVTGVSEIVHVGLNLTSEGIPPEVSPAYFSDSSTASTLAREVLQEMTELHHNVLAATTKVRPT